MRNPFKRRNRLKGATADWDESRQVDLGEYVAIPRDQMPAEWLARLEGVQIFEYGEGNCVLVNVGAARADVVRQFEAMAAEVDGLDEREFRAMTLAALDDPTYWVREEDLERDEEDDPEAEYSFFEIDMATAHVKFGEEAS